MGNGLSDRGELGAVAGLQLPAALELLSRMHNIASPAKKGQSVSLEKPIVVNLIYIVDQFTDQMVI